MRVTVVATGLGQAAKGAEKPKLVIDRKSSGDVNYDALDRPTGIRNKAAGDKYPAGTDAGMEYLDIPAFLRRQAD